VKAKLGLSILALAALCAVVVGCGGSNDETASAMTKKQFLMRVNTMCAKTVAEQQTAFKEAVEKAAAEGSEPDDAAKAAMIDGLLSPVRSMIDDMSELGAPAGDSEKIDQIVSGYEEGLSQAEDDPGRYLSGSAFAKADSAAADYGLERCAHL
jgi:hypothetical protein